MKPIRSANPMFAGVPVVLQGLLAGIFGLAGKAFASSWNRLTAVQKVTNEKLQQNRKITDQLGPNVEVSSPQQVIEKCKFIVG